MLELPLPVHEYVPVFVKEALAKSFLKKPERYLQKLYQQQKKREIKKCKKRKKEKGKWNGKKDNNNKEKKSMMCEKEKAT